MEFLENNWVVSLCSGIIVSLLFLWIGYRRKGKVYKYIVDKANTELVNSIIKILVDNNMPSLPTFSAIRRALARTHGIDIEDLYCENSIKDELLRRVYSNDFLTQEQKEKFNEIINSSLISPIEENTEEDNNVHKINRNNEDDSDSGDTEVIELDIPDSKKDDYLKTRSKEFFLEYIKSRWVYLFAALSIGFLIPTAYDTFSDYISSSIRNKNIINDFEKVNEFLNNEMHKSTIYRIDSLGENIYLVKKEINDSLSLSKKELYNR